MKTPHNRNNRPLHDEDMSDESEQDELDDIDSEDLNADEILYGDDASDFDLDYYDNEEEYYDEPDAIQYDDDED